MNSNELVSSVITSLKNHKGNDIVKIDVQGKTTITDFFVIVSARSSTQVKSLSEYLETDIEKLGGKAIRKEGIEDGRWAIIDFGDVMVHIFNDETRLFYHLEKLWGEGEKIVDED